MGEIGEVDRREECVIEWTIRNFFSLPDQLDRSYYGPLFSFEGADCRLTFYPNGREKNSEGYIEVFLIRESSGPLIDLNFSLALKTSNNEIDEERRYKYNFKNMLDCHGSAFFIKRSVLKERKSKLLPSGHLTFVCRLKHSVSTDAASDSSASGSAERRKDLCSKNKRNAKYPSGT